MKLLIRLAVFFTLVNSLIKKYGTYSMKFTHYDLQQLKVGQVVNIQLSGNAANVKLMDSINFNNYRNGRRYTYYGGYVTKTKSNLPIPNDGHWHLTIDLGGYPGSVRSSVNVS